MTGAELDEEAHGGLIDHLTELRSRLIWSLIGLFVGFLACWGFSDIIFDIIRKPISPHLSTETGGLVFTAPMDKFLAHIKVSFLASVVVTCPFWIYQVWMFVAPGLYKNEKKAALAFIFLGSALFITGVLFVYYVVFPLAFQFLMGFGGETDVPMITIGDYLSFFITATLVFGLAFEMPLILLILGTMGVVNAEMLSSRRRYAIVLLAILSAMATPPDMISMFLMLAPMLLLYELSILLVRFTAAKAEPA